MEMLVVIIGVMLTVVLMGKFNWKSNSTKLVIAAIGASIQTALVVYLMLTMKFPWN